MLEVKSDSKKLDCQLGQNLEECALILLVASLKTEHNHDGKVIGSLRRLGQQECKRPVRQESNRVGGRNVKG